MLPAVCTRILWSDSGVGPLSARTFDFLIPPMPALWWLPSGTAYAGGRGELSWVAEHDAACIRDLGVAWVDGINGAGLAMHLHVFRKGRYPEPDSRPSVHASNVVRWLLGTCASVSEAIDALSGVTIIDAWDADLGIPFINVSFALEDASGDSATVEGIDGRLHINRGPDTCVHSNAPGLDEHLDNLARYAPFGGDLPVPGNVTARDRFVRARYFLHYLPEPSDMREALASLHQVAQAVSLPNGAPYPSGDIFPTRWISGYDLAGRTLYFQPQFQPFLMWLELAHLDGVATPLSVDLRGFDLRGDLAPSLAPATLPNSGGMSAG